MALPRLAKPGAFPLSERHFSLADHNAFHDQQLIASKASDLPAGRQASDFRKRRGHTPDIKDQEKLRIAVIGSGR